MRIYATTFSLSAEQGIAPILARIQRWIAGREGRNARARADQVRKATRPAQTAIEEIDIVTPGSRQLASGSFLEVAHLGAENESALHAVRYSHRDSSHSGRRWVTEVGLRVDAGADDVEVSVYLYTDDLSANVAAPVTATRPVLVRELLNAASPIASTPGLSLIELSVRHASDFRALIRDSKRTYPVVVLSAAPDGTYPAIPAECVDQFGGLADVVCIPPSEDTRRLEAMIGDGLVPYAGAALIIFPPRTGPYATPIPVRRLLPDAFATGNADGISGARLLLGAVTERTNLVNARRHLSPERVREARSARLLKRQLSASASQDELHQAVQELRQQLEEQSRLVESKDAEVREYDDAWGNSLAELDQTNRRLFEAQQTVDALSAQLSVARDRPGEASTALTLARDAMLRLCANSATPVDCLHLLAHLYPDRLCVLPSALKSAEESEGFQHVQALWNALTTLADVYWTALVSGKPDGEARKVFPNKTFAAREANLSTDGRRKRTFVYKGGPIVMEPHLKIGTNGGSADTTLRVHFEWVSTDSVLVIGHCGRHIDF